MTPTVRLAAIPSAIVRACCPTRPANSYAVADLDYVEGYRGAARIVYDRRRTGEGAIWITVDHYDSFTAVPVGQ